MPLRKSPVHTQALLAANRANSLSSTGPRTSRGKPRASLNALKHGRHARRLAKKLVRGGYPREVALYSRVHSVIVRAFLAHGPFEEGVAAALATKVWCLRALTRKTKPECTSNSISKARCILRTRIVVKDYRRRVGLVFWVQRRRSPAGSLRRGQSAWRGWESVEPEGDIRKRLGARSQSGDPDRQPVRPLEQLEDAIRSWVHRLRRPRLEERIRYSLDHDGVHRTELEAEHWRDWPELCRFWGTPNAPAYGRRKW